MAENEKVTGDQFKASDEQIVECCKTLGIELADGVDIRSALADWFNSNPDALEYESPATKKGLPGLPCDPYDGTSFTGVATEEASTEKATKGKGKGKGKGKKEKKEKGPSARAKSVEIYNKAVEQFKALYESLEDVKVNIRQSGTSFFYKSNRFMKLVKAGGIKLELNAFSSDSYPSGITGFTAITAEVAKEKHMGSMNGLYTGTSFDDAASLAKAAYESVKAQSDEGKRRRSVGGKKKESGEAETPAPEAETPEAK